MFAALLQPATGNPFHTPPHPSPLSPRHANIPTSGLSQMSRSKQSFLDSNNNSGSRNQKPASSQPQSHYSQRYATKISNPAAQISRTHASREKRRDAFLNRVKRDRDDGLFEKRGEQIQRMDYLAQRRKYYEALAKAAPDTEPDEEGSEDGDGDVEMGAGGEGDWDEPDARALDEFISQEEQQLQALLEDMEESAETRRAPTESQHQQDYSYCEDEEDYDSLFADFIAQGEDPPPNQNDSNMDISHG